MLRLAELLLECGDGSEAAPLLDEALDHARSLERLPFVARALAMRVRTGQTSEHEAVKALEGIGAANTEAACRLTLWKATGDLDHLRAAHRAAVACEAGLSAPEREVVMRRSVNRREIQQAWAQHGDGAATPESETRAG
jgi:hypothetical protein